MKRKLLKQTYNEWRSNLWLAVELLIVSVVMWYITDWLATVATVRAIPMGVDTENCILVDTSRVPADHPDAEPADTTMESMSTSIRTILDRLRNTPDVEVVALASNQAVPYTQNSWFIQTNAADGKDSMCTYPAGWRAVSPDYIRLFRVSGANGETPDEIAEILARNEMLLSQDIFAYNINETQQMTDEQFLAEYKKSLTSSKSFLVGRIMQAALNDTVELRVGGIIRPIKRTEYETPNGAVMTLLDEHDNQAITSARIIIRTADGKTDKIATDILNRSTTFYRAGNSYISSMTPFSELRQEVQSEADEQVRNLVVIMLFLLASIFLGLLGTFWFRTQQRVSEIAIRIVNGATRIAVFRRLIGEGIMLLAAVTPIAAVCDWGMCHYQLNNCIYGWDFFEPSRFAATVAITFVMMALMIALGIWFPAYKAMRIEPAVALKDE